jgi:hypothetical protein
MSMAFHFQPPGGRLIAARSTLLGVRHRLHFTSSHGNPPLIACPIVGDAPRAKVLRRTLVSSALL